MVLEHARRLEREKQLVSCPLSICTDVCSHKFKKSPVAPIVLPKYSKEQALPTSSTYHRKRSQRNSSEEKTTTSLDLEDLLFLAQSIRVPKKTLSEVDEVHQLQKRVEQRTDLIIRNFMKNPDESYAVCGNENSRPLVGFHQKIATCTNQKKHKSNADHIGIIINKGLPKPKDLHLVPFVERSGVESLHLERIRSLFEDETQEVIPKKNITMHYEKLLQSASIIDRMLKKTLQREQIKRNFLLDEMYILKKSRSHIVNDQPCDI